ncbi:hypothetical protein HOLleu_31741 [Holothuria leucospilota]|uniref:Uncharacterized protein n=1 Tax=Holothuria leucospilota TaxID=206669 RepID=A0A9Q0YQV3_HOLLE|nr:hypothetical protein HOLleu_31741 [Holothuria leucospilota]
MFNCIAWANIQTWHSGERRDYDARGCEFKTRLETQTTRRDGRRRQDCWDAKRWGKPPGPRGQLEGREGKGRLGKEGPFFLLR